MKKKDRLSLTWKQRNNIQITSLSHSLNVGWQCCVYNHITAKQQDDEKIHAHVHSFLELSLLLGRFCEQRTKLKLEKRKVEWATRNEMRKRHILCLLLYCSFLLCVVFHSNIPIYEEGLTESLTDDRRVEKMCWTL